eukprot:753124_1
MILHQKKVSQSICFHDNALCTSVTIIPELNVGFNGGTDAQLYQFESNNLENAFSYSMQDMISKNVDQQKSSVMVNPPFIYSLDSKVLKNANNNIKQGLVAIALGNGTIALYAPTINMNQDKDKDEKQQDEEEIDIVNHPVCCIDMHQSAVSDISFGYHNNWLVSA